MCAEAAFSDLVWKTEIGAPRVMFARFLPTLDSYENVTREIVAIVVCLCSTHILSFCTSTLTCPVKDQISLQFLLNLVTFRLASSVFY